MSDSSIDRGRLRSAGEPALEIIAQYGDRGFTLLLLAVIGTQLFLTSNFSEDGQLFPYLVGIPLFVLLLVILAGQTFPRLEEEFREFSTDEMFTAGEQMESMTESEDVDRDATGTRLKVLSVILWVALLLAGIYVLGFLWAILVFSLAFYRVEADQSWLKSALYTLVIWGAIVIVFVGALNLRFYQGMFALPHPLPF